MSLLKEITGFIDSVKAAKLLLEKEAMSTDCVFLVDETYLQKSVQFHSGNFMGGNKQRDPAQGNSCVYDSVFKKVYSVCN